MIRIWLSSRLAAPELARRAVARFTGCEPSEVELGREPGGRPTARGVHIAISHTRELAAVAVTRLGPVGVDVEADRALPFEALARHWFAPEEAEWVAAHPRDFLLLWTQKEAAGKALGLGLREGGLRRLMPLPPRDGGPVPGTAGLSVGAWRRGGFVIGVAVTPRGAASPGGAPWFAAGQGAQRDAAEDEGAA